MIKRLLGIFNRSQRWEYTMLPMMPNDEGEQVRPWEYLEMINSMGAAGWELAGVSSNTLIFKRPQC